MRYFPYLLTILTFCTQPLHVSHGAQNDGPEPKQVVPGPSSQPDLPKTAISPGTPTSPIPEAPAPTPESEVDKLLREYADKIDLIPYVSGDIKQTVRLADRQIVSEGIYRKGPDFRMRFELAVNIGDAAGKRIQVCDGKMGYRFEDMLGTVSLQSFDVAALVPLIERKEINTEAKEQILSSIPFLKPGDMLRGLLRTLTFTDKEEGTLGEENAREVVILKGRWKDEVLQSITGGQAAADLEELGQQSFPQFGRVHIDKQTGWPLQIELYRQDKRAEYRPIFRLEFSNLTFAKDLPASEFAFTIPNNVVPQDVTSGLISLLQPLPDKAGAETSKGTPPTSSVSGLIEPTKPKTEEKAPEKKE